MADKDAALALATVVARAWQDEAFKRALIEHPNETLQAMGVPIAPGVEYRVVENTPTVRYFILPQPPRIETSSENATDSILSAWTPLMTSSVMTSGFFPNMTTGITARRFDDDESDGPRSTAKKAAAKKAAAKKAAAKKATAKKAAAKKAAAKKAAAKKAAAKKAAAKKRR